VLNHLRENVRRRNRPQLWGNNSWFPHHDNVLAHASLMIHDFLGNTNITVLPQPPYSPDLALEDFFLFPKLKSTLKGRFQMSQEINENTQMELRTILKKACQDCFQKWQPHWEHCINEGGEYFEGNKAHSVAGMSEKIIKKIVVKLFEQTTHTYIYIYIYKSSIYVEVKVIQKNTTEQRQQPSTTHSSTMDFFLYLKVKRPYGRR
jgi:hypothetical protein